MKKNGRELTDDKQLCELSMYIPVTCLTNKALPINEQPIISWGIDYLRRMTNYLPRVKSYLETNQIYGYGSKEKSLINYDVFPKEIGYTGTIFTNSYSSECDTMKFKDDENHDKIINIFTVVPLYTSEIDLAMGSDESIIEIKNQIPITTMIGRENIANKLKTSINKKNTNKPFHPITPDKKERKTNFVSKLLGDFNGAFNFLKPVLILLAIMTILIKVTNFETKLGQVVGYGWSNSTLLDIWFNTLKINIPKTWYIVIFPIYYFLFSVPIQEYIFRVLPLKFLPFNKTKNILIYLFVISIIFALLHLYYMQPISVALVCGMGILNAIIYAKYRSFMAICLLHAITASIAFSFNLA